VLQKLSARFPAQRGATPRQRPENGAGDHVRIPYRGRGKPASKKDANRAHAQLRFPGERASARLRTWHFLRELRCCPWRAGQLAKAIHVLQTCEIGG
jgi:hypothetical protein